MFEYICVIMLYRCSWVLGLLVSFLLMWFVLWFSSLCVVVDLVVLGLVWYWLLVLKIDRMNCWMVVVVVVVVWVWCVCYSVIDVLMISVMVIVLLVVVCK